MSSSQKKLPLYSDTPQDWRESLRTICDPRKEMKTPVKLPSEEEIREVYARAQKADSLIDAFAGIGRRKE